MYLYVSHGSIFYYFSPLWILRLYKTKIWYKLQHSKLCWSVYLTFYFWGKFPFHDGTPNEQNGRKLLHLLRIVKLLTASGIEGTEVQRVRRSTRRSTGGTCLWASPPRPSSSSSSRPRTARPRPGAVCRPRPSPRTRPRPRTGRSRSRRPRRCWATGRCWRRPAPTPRQSSRN